MSDAAIIDPMKGQFAAIAKGKVPAGQYLAEFVGVSYIPPTPDDPMTGKKGRQWPNFKFKWKVANTDQAGQFVERDTPVPEVMSPNTGYAQWVGFLLGRPVGAEQFDLSGCVGKRYMVTVAEKKNKAGQPSGWLHVEQCIRLPDA